MKLERDEDDSSSRLFWQLIAVLKPRSRQAGLQMKHECAKSMAAGRSCNVTAQ